MKREGRETCSGSNGPSGRRYGWGTRFCVHGEYKIPGGKLVVIDLDVIDGMVRNVELSGDFFLEPEEALGWMTAALEGLPVHSSQAALAERVRVAVAQAELLGITPEGVAVAVRRAVEAGDGGNQ